MTKKSEAEKAIRSLAFQWAKEINYIIKPGWYPSFTDFERWLNDKSYGHYLNFRSSAGPHYDAEKWLEDELKDWPTRSDDES
ncbi:hypothetical protein [Methylobacterium platani]|nr:hypothetical protein [Methylobacterium platani]